MASVLIHRKSKVDLQKNVFLTFQGSKRILCYNEAVTFYMLHSQSMSYILWQKF